MAKQIAGADMDEVVFVYQFIGLCAFAEPGGPKSTRLIIVCSLIYLGQFKIQ
jgi:hypothetical protein